MSDEYTRAEVLAILWRIDARALFSKLLSLGTYYTVKVSTNTPPPSFSFSDLGLKLALSMNSDCLKVSQKNPKSETDLHLSLHTLPNLLNQALTFDFPPAPAISSSSVDGIIEHDILIGIDERNLIWFPLSLNNCERFIESRINGGSCDINASERSELTVTLHFIRLKLAANKKMVPHLSRDVQHVLEEIQDTYQALLQRYEAFEHKRMMYCMLQKERKLLSYAHVKIQQLRHAVRSDGKYQQALRFSRWYKNVMLGMEGETPASEEKKAEASQSSAKRRTHSVTFQRQTKKTDTEWIDLRILKQNLKWLPKAHSFLDNFMRGLVQSFAQDQKQRSVERDERLTYIAKEIVLALTQCYIDKRKAGIIMEDTDVYKRFAKHARMLRSNIKNPENKQLRHNIVSEAVLVQRLCEMSSEELAPKALQEERIRLHQRGLQNSTIRNPIGKTLVKTKHGYKEVDFGGVEESQVDGVTISSPPLKIRKRDAKEAFASVQPSIPAVSSSVPSTQAPSSSAPVAPVQAQKKKRVSFAAETSKTQKYNPNDAASAVRSLVKEPPQPTPDNSVETAQTFASLLLSDKFDAHKRIDDFRQKLLSGTIKRLPSQNEFEQNLKLFYSWNYNNLAQTFEVRFRLAGLYGEAEHLTDLGAHLDALAALEKALTAFERLLHDAILDLKSMFPALVNSHEEQLYLQAFTHLQKRKIAKLSVLPMYGENGGDKKFQGRVAVESLVLSYACCSTIAETRMAAILAFMKLFAGIVKRLEEASQAEEQVKIENDVSNFVDRIYEQNLLPETEEPYQYKENLEKIPIKRVFEPNESKIRSPRRRKYDIEPVVKKEIVAPPPLFVVDRLGRDEERKTPASITKDEKLRMLTIGYQELIKTYFGDQIRFTRALQTLGQDLEEEEKTFEFSKHLQLKRTLKKQALEGIECALETLDRHICVVKHAETCDKAVLLAREHLEQKIHKLALDWTVLLQTYMIRKERTKNGIMAVNETRTKHPERISSEEGRAGHLYFYKISVHRIPIVRSACSVLKDAKRAATEAFRDIFDTIAAMPSMTAPSSSVQPTPRVRVAQSKVVASSDSDSGEDSDDGTSNSDSEWFTSKKDAITVKQEEIKVESATVAAANVPELYDIHSESAHTDDARFRAILGSLYSGEKYLFSELNDLRRALKFRGAAEHIVSRNVKAVIKMERLQEGILQVFVSLNDVIHHTASSESKQVACDSATDGMIEKLREIQAVWTQMLRFFQHKVLGSVDILSAFHALCLSNIARIEVAFEDPPVTALPSQKCLTHLICVLRIHNYVVMRTKADEKQTGRYSIYSQTAAFFVHLIDANLKTEEKDPARITINECMDSEKETKYDFTCSIRLRDPNQRDTYQEFTVCAAWCGPRESYMQLFEQEQMIFTHTQQIGTLRVEKDYQKAKSCFRLVSIYEQAKFVSALIAYGHKDRNKSMSLLCSVRPHLEYRVILLPPGGSINCTDLRLYYPKRNPTIATDWRNVYGMLQSPDSKKIL